MKSGVPEAHRFEASGVQVMVKALVFLIMTGAGVGMGWMGMIYGWGLEPQSWPWIVGSTVGGIVLVAIGRAVVED